MHELPHQQSYALNDLDFSYLRRAVNLALEAERTGNLPIGAVITLDGEAIAEAGNAVLSPFYHPGRHAEMEAFALVPAEAWPRAREMTCYTTLEPCLMCAGASLLHGIGRVVFGAKDTEGGAGYLFKTLPPYYFQGAGAPLWVGPALPEICDEMFARALARFDALPCGRNSF